MRPAVEPRSIRLIPRLRAVHVERFFETTPATMIYFEDSYDLKGVEIPPGINRMNIPEALAYLARSDAEVLELPEPLWVRFLPVSALCAAAFKLGGLVRLRRRHVVTYCMENSTIPKLIGRHWTPPRWLSATFAGVVGAYVRTFVDRMAFASPVSRDLYHSIPFVSGVENTTVLELPTANPVGEAAHPHDVIFVGTTDERKGVLVLLATWPQVEAALPDARLTIVGPQADETDDLHVWAAANPSQRRYLGQLSREDVLEEIQRSGVLVLPSVPHGRWREQIGLPIKEALSFGLTVVTTDQTGLAPWLADQGHVVLDPAKLREGLPQALIEALRAPISREVVVRSLPEVQGRYAADSWMHR